MRIVRQQQHPLAFVIAAACGLLTSGCASSKSLPPAAQFPPSPSYPPEHRYTLDELSQLYFSRWRIEVNFAHLKTTMGMDVLKCKTVDGVLKELIVFALVYNLVRAVMGAAALRQRVDVERISFIDAARWLASATSTEQLIRLVVNPDRPFRYEPRRVND